MNHTKTKYQKAMDAIAVFLIILAVHFVIGAFNGKWPWSDNPYNSYLLQALSWLDGRLDLGSNYEWLELAIYNGKYFVSFPPFPSIVYLPFAFFFGEKTPEGWIAFFVMMLGAFYALRLAWHYLGEGAKAVFWTVFLYVGTNVLYDTIDAGVWFVAQSFALTLSLMAIFYAVNGKGGLSLFFWACSIGCRPFQIVYLPLLLYILYHHLKKEDPNRTCISMIREKFLWAVPVAVVALTFMALNMVRFGNPAQFGHDYLPEFTDAEYGQFSSHYISENIKSLFRLPVKMDNNTLAFYVFNGNCIFLVSPLFVSYVIYLIRKVVTKQKINPFLLIGLPFLVILHIFVLCAHKTMGGFHFGHRYINDTLPYVFWAVLMFAGTKERHQKTIVHAPAVTDAEEEAESNTLETTEVTQETLVTEADNDSTETVLPDYTYCLHYGLCALGLCINIVGTIATNMGWIS